MPRLLIPTECLSILMFDRLIPIEPRVLSSMVWVLPGSSRLSGPLLFVVRVLRNVRAPRLIFGSLVVKVPLTERVRKEVVRAPPMRPTGKLPPAARDRSFEG